MGDYGDGSCGNGRVRGESISEQSTRDANAYNQKHGGERCRIVVIIDGNRYVGEDSSYPRSNAMGQAVEIERRFGVRAFVVSETIEALR